VKTNLKTTVAAAALILGGVGVGTVLTATGSATAADTSGSSSTSATASKGHAGETLLTGTTADKVKAAALAKYPGATIVRVETDSDGVYEAHITTKAGDEVTVEVDKSFTVTGTESHGAKDSSSSTS